VRFFFLMVFSLLAPDARAADVSIVSTFAYDNNVYEALTNAQSGLTNRISVNANGLIWRGKSTVVRFEQQAGFKRIWQNATGQANAGDVFVEQFFLHSAKRIGQRVTLGLRGGVKFKQATRAPGEESYFRSGIDGDLALKLTQSITGRMRFGFGEDDSRDVLVPQTQHKMIGSDLVFARSRTFSAHLRFSTRWINYDRFALTVDKAGFILPLVEKQVDRATTLNIGGQLFTGMLFQADYALSRNASNSFGYPYWSHRIQAVILRHLGAGFDGQLFLQFHLRLYDDELPSLARGAESDEYEQSIGVLKFSRQIATKHTLALQYGFYRNGARQGIGFYRKHVYSIVFETKL